MYNGYRLCLACTRVNNKRICINRFNLESGITNITQKEINGGVTEKSKSYTATTANFDIGFTQPGDYVIYDIEVTNSGTLDAVISNINIVTDNNPAIIYTTSGLQQGDKITKNGDKKYLTVKIEYDSNVTSQPALDDNDITLQMDYQQDLGQFDPITYETYSIGDKITFAGSDWYVIKNSSSDEDYVTLMKEKVLTYTELGNYAFGRNHEQSKMSYYWSDTCHYSLTYGTDTYTTQDISGCNGHNSYDESNLKTYLEEIYMQNLDENNLKDIDGYKIRLITLSELQNNLGISKNMTASWYTTDVQNTPSWVYQNFGEEIDNIDGYWTMTKFTGDSTGVWCVDKWQTVTSNNSIYYPYSGSVRSVINLLKSAIE